MTVALGCAGPNQMKAFLRCGMGPCQGRLCGLTVTELIAEARGVPPAEVGYYRLRPPVKPITLAELASLPNSERRAQGRGARRDDEHRRRRRHRRRHPWLLDGAASCLRGLKTRAGREGLCRPPRLGRQCRRRAPARARHRRDPAFDRRAWICGNISRIWWTTIAASRAMAAGAGRGERDGIRGARAPRRRTRARGFAHEEMIDRAELCRLVPAVARALRRRNDRPRPTARPIPTAPRWRSGARRKASACASSKATA